MEITARGWNRNMGPNYIGQIAIETIEMKTNEVTEIAYYNKATAYKSGYGINITWHNELRLNGNYRIDVILRRDEIRRLFISTFGNIFTEKQMRKLGIQINDTRPVPEKIAEILDDVSFGDVVRVIVNNVNKEAR